MPNICIHSFIEGKVQGVWYRASACEQAKALGLTGWVTNLADGRVELVACGPEDKISHFVQWLSQGPENATVNDVTTTSIATEDHDDFEVR